MQLTLLGVGAMRSPSFAPAGLLVAHAGIRVAFDGGPGAEPAGRLDAWRVAAKLGDVAKADESERGCREQHAVGGQQQPGGSRVEHGQHAGCAAVGFRADT
jgi:hypothetical protein